MGGSEKCFKSVEKISKHKILVLTIYRKLLHSEPFIQTQLRG